jgi:hypothetical protein
VAWTSFRARPSVTLPHSLVRGACSCSGRKGTYRRRPTWIVYGVGPSAFGGLFLDSQIDSRHTNNPQRRHAVWLAGRWPAASTRLGVTASKCQHRNTKESMMLQPSVTRDQPGFRLWSQCKIVPFCFVVLSNCAFCHARSTRLSSLVSMQKCAFLFCGVVNLDHWGYLDLHDNA